MKLAARLKNTRQVKILGSLKVHYIHSLPCA